MLRKALWFRLFLTFTLLISSVPSHAGFLVVPGLGSFSISKLTAAGVQHIRTAKSATGEVIYEFLDEGGKVLRTFTFGKATAEQLKEFTPSKIERYFAYLKENAGKITMTKLKEFPLEAFSFFVAIGAVTTSNLIFSYNENPVAMDQFLQSQKSVVGQIGFASFMVANGLTSEPLMAVSTSKLRIFIPYLGMSVGMIASNIVHEVAHIPHLTECALTFTNCDKAYEAWTKISLKEKGHEWAPGLFSMIASTVISGGVEWGLKAGAALVARMVAIELVMSLTPSGWVVRGARWTYKVAQLAGFVWLDNILRAPMVFTWKNAVQLGPELRDASRRIGILTTRKFANGWREETELNSGGKPVCTEKVLKGCYNDLDRELTAFQQLMGKWREANLESVLMAHGNWSQYLHQLSSQYRVARQFYFDFVSDLWKKKFELPADYQHLMDRSMPLFGVTPKGLAPEDADKLVLQPNKVRDLQLETIADVVTFLNDKDNKAALAPFVQKLRTDEQGIFNRIVNGLASKDLQKVGEALQELRYRLWKDPMIHPAPTSRELMQLLEPIFQALGDPKPLMAPGQGYLKLLTMDPNNSAYKNNPFPKGTGMFQTPLATEYLVYAMFMGPDVERGETTISKNWSGFPATFNPPMLRSAGSLKSVKIPPSPMMSMDLESSIFSMKIWVNGEGGGTMFDFLRSGGIRPGLLGDQKGHKMDEWWERYPENELAKAWLVYENKYEDIIQDFYRKLTRKEDSFTNRGPIANGILDGLEQERSIYLYILEAFLNSTENKTSVRPLNNSEYSVLEAAKSVEKSERAWTQNMLKEWKKARALFDRLQEKPVLGNEGKKTFLVSRVTNKEIGDQLEVLNKLVKEFPGNNWPMTEFQKKLIGAAVQGLLGTQQELANYEMIINNVSYVENFVGRNSSEPVKRRCLNAPAARGTSQWLNAQYQGCSQ